MNMLRRITLALLLTVMSISAMTSTGCGGDTGPTAPEKFAPPPTEKDEVSSDKG